MATVTVRGGGGIDTSDFKQLVKAIRKATPQVATDLRKELRDAGAIVATTAKVIAAEGSSSIPATIKVRTSGASVSVIAGNGQSPLPGLFELGNTGGRKSASASRSGVFRHPVYGNRDVWVSQRMHPFLAPAALATAQVVQAKVEAVLDRATRTITLEG